MTEKKLEELFKIVEDTAQQSTCLRRKVGAVIIKDDIALGTGYNGAPDDLTPCTELGCLRKQLNIPSGERAELCRAVHAEQRALCKVLTNEELSTDGATLVCTTLPCAICAKLIIQAKISRVYYKEHYPDTLSISLFADSKVELYQVG